MLRAVILVAAALVAGSFNPASAEIARHCRGAIMFEPSGVDTGSGWRHSTQGSRTQFLIGVVDGRGYCRNRARAGQCRDRARRALFSCHRALWRERWTPSGVNDACAPSLDSSRPPHAHIVEWARGGEGDIKGSIERQMCCDVEPDARSVTGAVVAYGYESGHRQCGGREVLEPAYVARCAELRDAGLCRPRRVSP